MLVPFDRRGNMQHYPIRDNMLRQAEPFDGRLRFERFVRGRAGAHYSIRLAKESE